MSILAAIPFLGGIGIGELLIVGAIVLLLFGPKRLPQLGKSLGKTVKAIREGVDGQGGEEKEASADDEDAVAEPAKATAKKTEEAAE